MDTEIDLLEKLVLSPNKFEALEGFPKNSDLKSCLYLYYSLDSQDFLKMMNDDRNLSSANRTKLELLYNIRNLTSPDCVEKIKKKFMRQNYLAPPSELRAQIKSKLPSALDPTILKVDYEKAANNLNLFSMLTPCGKMKVRVSEMSEKVFSEFIKLGFNCLLVDGVIERIASENLIKNPNPLVNFMTIDQLTYLEKLNPPIAFTKNFVIRKINLEYNFPQMNLKEKYFALNSLYEYSKVSKIPEFFAAVLANLILISSQLLEFEKKWIVEYFACHRSSSIYKENNGLSDAILKEFLSVLIQIPSEIQLIQEYLDHFLPEIKDFEVFLYPMHQNEAKKFFARARVLAGYNVSEYKDFMPESELLALERLNELTILPNNAEVFAVNEVVRLVVRIKRIKHLTVRVFEINGKNYYSDTSKTLNFDGLSASFEYVFTYSQPGQTRHNEVFEFPELNKPGIFFVEFMGKDLRASAIIKKGSLKCLIKNTVAGQAVTLIDENNQVCESGGVFLDDKFYPLSKTYVIIPFAQVNSVKNLVLTNGEIFSGFKFNHLTSNFSLDCGVLLNEEQLVVGNQATIFITPKIRIYDKECEDFIVSKIQCKLITVDIDDLTSIKDFNNILYTPEPIPLSFSVPPRLKGCKIEVKATIKAGKSEHDLNFSKFFQVNSMLSSQNLYSIYFRKNNKDYYIEVRGRNGELWENIELNIKLNSKYSNNSIDTQLVTNENGIILLGELKGITSVQARTGNMSALLNLDIYKSSINYPQEIILCEGDKYSLPLCKKPKKSLNSFVVLLELSEKRLKKIVSDKISFNEESNCLVISDLEKGKYELKFFRNNVNILFTVTDGVHYNNLEYVISESLVNFAPKQFDYFRISTETGENEVKVLVQGCLNKAVAYVLYSNFLPAQDFAKELRRVHNPMKSQQWTFDKCENTYFGTSKISEEYSYIMRRNRQPGFIGNTLPRPQLLMKRQDQGVTFTETNAPKLGGSAYEHPSAPYSYSACVPQMPGTHLVDIKSDLYSDFLQIPSKWLIIPLTAPEFSVPINPSFSNLSIFIDNQTCVSSSFLSFDSKLQTRDLTVPSTLSPSKNYIELNLSAGVKKGEEFLLRNCENSFEIIDSVKKLFSVIRDVSGNSELADWHFLGEWENLSEDSKSEKIKKFYSHELNIFVFCKDPEYFDRVLKPFIQNKLEKDLVDLYLLGESLAKYSDMFESLNNLEQSLYILWLSSVEAGEFDRKLKGFIERAEKYPVESAFRNLVFMKVFQSSKTSSNMGVEDGLVSLDPQINIMRAQMKGLFGSGPPPPPPPPANFNSLCKGGPPPPPPPMGAVPSMYLPTSPNAPMPPGGSRVFVNQGYNPTLDDISNELCELDDHDVSRKRNRMVSKKKESFNLGFLGGSMQCRERLMDMDVIPRSELLNVLESQPFYKKMDSTKQYKETQYYSKNSCNGNISHSLNFWTELIKSKSSKQEFLSEKTMFTDCTLANLICALAFTDLPFTPDSHEYTVVGKSVKILAKSNFLIFFKDFSETSCENSGQVLAAHQYFNKVSNQFVNKLIKQTLYECNLVVSNITCVAKYLEILQVLPVGSIPISPPQSIKNIVINLAPYSTSVVKYSFYFPYSGNFAFLPASISEKGQVIASAATINPCITDSETIEVIKSFSDVVLTADNDKILQFVQSSNPYVDIQLEKIYYKLFEKDFYSNLIAILEEKNYYDETVSSFSLVHQDIPRIIKYLKKNKEVKNLLSSMWEEVYEEPPHIEFSPLVSARAHQLGQQKQIANASVLNQYKSLLVHLAFKQDLSLSDKLKICQYFLYKNDFSRAKDLFDSFSEYGIQFSTEKLLTGQLQIQLDYLHTYFYPEKSHSLISNYLNYPILHWREKFEEIHKILNEVTALYSPESVKIAESPGLSYKIDGSTIKLDHCGLDSCTISFYTLNLEVIFSLNPEMNEENFNFGYSKPVKEMKFSLSASGKDEFSIPDDLQRKNLFIEVEFAGTTKKQIVYSAEFRHLIFENQGVIKVLDRNNKPKPGIYVKTFAQRGGKFEFYKDGFTDIRGKFDYVSVANSNLENLQKFSILISDKSLGELVVYANPPN